MFGYVNIDKPNMLIKDYYLYRSFYCGICKAFKRHYSQAARFLTNYDVTFLAVLAFAVAEQPCEIRSESCILNPFVRKPIVAPNDLLLSVVDVTVLLGEYKLSDDILDGDRKKKILRGIFKRDIRRAESRQPEIATIMRLRLEELYTLEREQCDSCDRVAGVFGEMLREVFKVLMGEKYTPESGDLVFGVGRWVYLADALDDIEDDYKSGNYNVFLLCYAGFADKKQFFAEHREDIEFILGSAYNGIHSRYEHIPNTDYEGVLTNVLWYGIKSRNQRLLDMRTEPKPWERMSEGFGKRIK